MRSDDRLKLLTRSSDATMALGRRLGTCLAAGCVVALEGDLGAGKTWLTKGIVRGCAGVAEAEVTSPTFALLHEYAGSLPVYHLDAYRLRSGADLEPVGLEACLEPADGVTVIEWADRIGDALPADLLRIRIREHGPEGRIICLESSGPQSRRVLARFAAISGDVDNECDNAV